jgi:hypothetical protein
MQLHLMARLLAVDELRRRTSDTIARTGAVGTRHSLVVADDDLVDLLSEYDVRLAAQRGSRSDKRLFYIQHTLKHKDGDVTR